MDKLICKIYKLKFRGNLDGSIAILKQTVLLLSTALKAFFLFQGQFKKVENIQKPKKTFVESFSTAIQFFQ